MFTAGELNWADLHQVDPVTRRVIGHARQRYNYKVDWLQCSSVQFICCEHSISTSVLPCDWLLTWNNNSSWDENCCSFVLFAPLLRVSKHHVCRCRTGAAIIGGTGGHVPQHFGWEGRKRKCPPPADCPFSKIFRTFSIWINWITALVESLECPGIVSHIYNSEMLILNIRASVSLAVT